MKNGFRIIILLILFNQIPFADIVPGQEYFVYRESLALDDIHKPFPKLPLKTSVIYGDIVLATDETGQYDNTTWRKYKLVKLGGPDEYSKFNTSQRNILLKNSFYLIESNLTKHKLIPLNKINAGIKEYFDDPQIVAISRLSELKLSKSKVKLPIFDDPINANMHYEYFSQHDKYYYSHTFSRDETLNHIIYRVLTRKVDANDSITLALGEELTGSRSFIVSDEVFKNNFVVLDLVPYLDYNKIVIGGKYQCVLNTISTLIRRDTNEYCDLLHLNNGQIVKVIKEYISDNKLNTIELFLIDPPANTITTNKFIVLIESDLFKYSFRLLK